MKKAFKFLLILIFGLFSAALMAQATGTRTVVTDKLDAKQSIKLKTRTITDFTTDTTLATNSDAKLPTERAVRKYVDARINAGGGGSVFVTSPLTGSGTSLLPISILDNSIPTGKLQDGAVTAAKLSSMSATSGQVLKWNGSAWAPGTDNTGGGGGSSDFTNIEVSGAVGDGTTDNTSVIRAAFLLKKPVYVPEGIFVCDSLVLPPGSKLIGAGYKSVLRFKSSSSNRFIDCSNSNIEISNVRISGATSLTNYSSSGIQGTRIGIYISSTQDNSTFINNCWIEGFDGAGIAANGSQSFRGATPHISGCSLKSNWIGIQTNLNAAQGIEYLRVQNNTIGYSRFGIYLNSGNVDITGNTISDNRTGIYVGSGGSGGNGGHGNISNNLINHSIGAALNFVSVPQGFTITSNNIFFGDVILSGTGLVVSLNNFGQTTGDTVRLDASTSSFFINNYYQSIQTVVVGSGWDYSNNKLPNGLFDKNLYNIIFNSQASYNTSTNTFSAPNVSATSRLSQNVSASAGFSNYLITSNSASSNTLLNPGLLTFQTSGTFPAGIDLGYNPTNGRYRNRVFTSSDKDLSLSTCIPTATGQSDFTDRVVVRGDNGRVGINQLDPVEMLDVVGNVKASGNLIASGLNVSGNVTFNGRVSAVDFRQTANASASFDNYFRTSNNSANTVLLNPGVLLYSSGNTFGHGMDMGFNNGRFRTRLFSANDIAFSKAPDAAADDQTDFVDIMVINTSTSRIGINTLSPSEALDVAGNIKSNSLAGSGNRLAQVSSTGVIQPTSIDPSSLLNKIAVFSNTSTARGLSIVADSLKMHAASFTNPGAVSLTAQAFSGQKTFQQQSASVVTPVIASNNNDSDGQGVGFAFQNAGVIDATLIVQNPVGDYTKAWTLNVNNGTTLEPFISVNGTIKSTTFDNAMYYEVANSSGTTFQIDGTVSTLNVTGSTTTVTLPEIVSGTIGANQVGIGYVVYISNDTGSSVTIQRAGTSDTIEGATSISLAANAGVFLRAMTLNKWFR